jgi:hypothetical protein
MSLAHYDLGEGPEPLIVQRIKVAQRKLHVPGLVPLGYVAVAKARQPDHVEHERHTDIPAMSAPAVRTQASRWRATSGVALL